MSGRKWQQSSTPQAHGKIASEMTLGEAIVRGILPEPKYVTEEGLPLGRWLSDISNKVSDENLRRVSLTDEQLERLKGIGFKQEKKTARQWNEKYELAKNYYEIHGDLNVPLSYCVNDVKLGRWISNIRSKRKHPGSNGMALSQERIRQLDNIGMNWK